MASVSYSLTRGTTIDTLSVGAQTVTAGTSAPGAGDLEIRIDLTKNFTKNELELAFDTIWRFIENSNNDTNFPL
jgi:hypothetical protein